MKRRSSSHRATATARIGEGYVRLSLTLADDRIDEGLRRIAALPALA